MTASTRKRKRRSVIISPWGLQRLQEAQEQLAGAINRRSVYTLEQLSEMTGLSARSIGRIRSGKAAVDRQTLEKLFEAFHLKLTERDYIQSEAAATLPGSLTQDWGEAPDVSCFYGRTTELDTLSKWILQDHCRLVGILGIGGVGKTAPSVKLVEQTLQTGTTQVYEFEIEIEGDRRYQEAQISVSGEDEVLIVVRDITERKRAEAERKQVETALQEKEEQLRLALDFTQTGIWHWHIHDDRLLWNENTAQLMGLSPDQIEVSVDTWSNCVHPEDLPYVCQDEDYALENHTSHSVEYRVIWPDGTVRWMLVRGHGIYDETGQAACMVGVVMDITDRKQMEAALQQSEQCYRAIVEDQTELIIRYRADTTLTFVNEAFCRYFGVKREEIIGTSYQPMIVLDDRDYVDQLIKSLSAENPVVMIENQVIAANGDIRWTQWINRVILNEQNQIVEFQSVGRDITDRKQIA